MPKVKIPSIGRSINVPEGSTDAEVDQFVEEAIAAHNAAPKKYDWISDVTGGIGSIVGGIGGAYVGGPAGAIAGSSTLGALGGAGGEAIEDWLDPKGRQGSDYFDTATTEGLFGLIPGLAGAGVKGTARAVQQVGSKLPITKEIGQALKQTEGFWHTFSKRLSDIPNKQRKKLLNKWMKDNNVNIGDVADDKIPDFIKAMDDLILKDKNLRKKFPDKEALEASRKELYDKWYRDQVAKGVLTKGTAAAVGTNVYLDAAGNEDLYNKGGLSSKISKIYKEGYTAPGQAYAIAKSMGYNKGKYFK